jgi:hypothetical protein
MGKIALGLEVESAGALLKIVVKMVIIVNRLRSE